MKKTFLLTLFTLLIGVTMINAQESWPCPDLGPAYGSNFSGNVADPDNACQFVAIWFGVTVGCVSCPPGLVYSEIQNECVFDLEGSNSCPQPTSSCSYEYENYTLETDVFREYEATIGILAKGLPIKAQWGSGAVYSISYCDPCWAHSDNRHQCCYDHTGTN